MWLFVRFQHDLKEVEEKFRKAMILNAQLDNDKAALGYQLELLKDRIEELHEEYAQLQVNCHNQALLSVNHWKSRKKVSKAFLWPSRSNTIKLYTD